MVLESFVILLNYDIKKINHSCYDHHPIEETTVGLQKTLRHFSKYLICKRDFVKIKDLALALIF